MFAVDAIKPDVIEPESWLYEASKEMAGDFGF